MSALARQLTAAQRQYDAMSPPEPAVDDDVAIQDAILAVEGKLQAACEVGCVLEDLYGDGYTLDAFDRLLTGQPLQHGDRTCLQTLLRRLRVVNAAVERELELAA